MKRTHFLLALIASLIFLFSSCGNKTAETGDGAVELLCDCFVEADIENEYDLMDLEHDDDLRKEVIKCILPILEDARTALDDMNDDERADYFNDAINAAVDCECGQKLLAIGGKLYDTKDAEHGFDEIIQSLEWIGGYYGMNSLFGGGYYAEEAAEEYYYDDYYDDDYYEEEYPEYEEDCYGDYYSVEMDLIDLFMYNVSQGNIVIGETTWEDMDYYTGDGDGFDRDYDGIWVSGYFEYDEEYVLQYISLDYYYECEGDLEYVDMDQSSLRYSIDESLSTEGEEDGEYEDPDIIWYFDDMIIRQTNYSDGYAIYIEPEDYYDY